MVRDDALPVSERHFAILDQTLENAHDLQRCLIDLVQQQHASELGRLDERRILPVKLAANDRRRLRQRLNRRVAVQLHVLALAAQQLKQPVGDAVLAAALVADRQQVPLSERQVLEHLVHDARLRRHVVVHNVGHERRAARHGHRRHDVTDRERQARCRLRVFDDAWLEWHSVGAVVVGARLWHNTGGRTTELLNGMFNVLANRRWHQRHH